MGTAALGAILAGGRSTRFGEPKALAEVGGARVIDRVAAALGRVTPEIVIVGRGASSHPELGFETIPDLHPGSGALSGVETAMVAAGRRGADVALVVACDMPFLAPDLLELLTRRAGRDRVLLPESRGPLGIEPLCGAYGVGCIPEVGAAVAAGERSLGRLADTLDAERIPLAEVERFGPPERLFFNLNRPEDLVAARALAAESAADAARRSNTPPPSPGTPTP